jgi:hypothetical protein
MVVVRMVVRALHIGIPLPGPHVHVNHARILHEIGEDPLDVVMDDGPQASGEVGARVPMYKPLPRIKKRGTAVL